MSWKYYIVVAKSMVAEGLVFTKKVKAPNRYQAVAFFTGHLSEKHDISWVEFAVVQVEEVTE